MLVSQILLRLVTFSLVDHDSRLNKQALELHIIVRAIA
jgi:hypothetical protein